MLSKYDYFFGTVGSSLEEDGLLNKQIRFYLYREVYNVMHGFCFCGGIGDRVPLPKCAVGEIRDHYPEADGDDSIGFEEKW